MLYLLASTFLAVHCYSAVLNTLAGSSASKDTGEQMPTLKVTTLLEIEENEINTTTNNVKTRFKRQQSGGAGKFTEAATMPQLKVLRLFLTMFKNLWAASYVGGAHPFHHYVPKPIVQLYKQKIVEFFFPDVGDDAIKAR